MTLDRMGKQKKQRLLRMISYVVLSAWVLITLVPIIFTILTAFKSDPEISMASFRWLPESFGYLVNFKQAFAMGDWIQYFKNSALITVVTVVGSLLFNSMAGYAFARLKFRGKEPLFMSVLLGMMVSPQSIIIPQYIMMRSVPLCGGNNILGQGGTGLLDSYISLIVPFLAGAFGIFLCRQFYSTFPSSLDEAARIDGCGVIKTYFIIYLPLSKTILATLTILKSVATWNDFFYPLIMTQSEKMKTVQLGLQMFRGSSATHYNYLMAATIITVIPMVIVYACAQKYFVQGIVSSGMKN
ncbi:MAG TPA: carbohydrate ABC transporter permease [Candidatus Pelethocola excrementipullorum]|nr:carbohydrate ABC transporter permease [Candidatus Pelethocola excrementipullorum]